MSDYKHVVIDDQKNIILPEELKNHMVQGDHNVKTIVFDCQRYSDGRDLSAMAIYICYIRADKEPGSDKAVNITIDPEDTNLIHFEWIPKIDATFSSGILTFLVCAEKTDEEGNLENGWHTKLCKDLKIAEGMDCLKAIAEKYPAIITYIITRIDDFEAGGTGGAGLTITDISESSEDGGSNVVTFSDGKTLTVKNGSKGATGSKGDTGAKGEKGERGEKGEPGADGYTPLKGTDYFTEADKKEIVNAVLANFTDVSEVAM